MRRIEFPGWPEVLCQAELSQRSKHSFEITIRWYLSFCRRARTEVTVQSARDFIAWATEEKHPQPWRLISKANARTQRCRAEGVPIGTDALSRHSLE